ncbi:hypothetical protein CTheo_4834 [Ceratobasidium theobromae]|uniref:Myb-like domain-containing protein n=1 Tax=Ceratobasidium theobromae TaxID=1582974 RepID=A0A5N5QIZ7_9AGAM|nr:hypothetical protein CTheo_4834 [Ceratobasidium theobromae]
MPSQHASHVPSGYAYTPSSQSSASHAPVNPTSYDLPNAPSMSTASARSVPPTLAPGFHPQPMSSLSSRSLPLHNTSNTPYTRHFQHYDQLALAGNYGSPTFDQGAAHQHNHIGQSTLPFPQSVPISQDVGHELQNAFLDSMPPPGTDMPSSSEHIDPMTTHAPMRTSPPHTAISKRARHDSFSQPGSSKRTRTSAGAVRPTGLSYSDDAWEMSGFSIPSQHGRALSRPTSELSGVNSPADARISPFAQFHPDNRGPSSFNSGPTPRFLASPASDRPQSANSLPRSPEVRTMNGITQIPVPSNVGSSIRPFASPQRRFSSASSHIVRPTSIPDAPTSQSPTLPGHPTPDGINPYYTPPSSGLRASAGATSGSSFASTSTLNATGGPDAFVTTSSDDGSSNVSHSMGETEVIASFPQFYDRVRALCLRFNNDAANLLVSFNTTQEPAIPFEALSGSLITFLSRLYARATPQDVLAQSFQMGTGADPMRMLNDAKAICERMMASLFRDIPSVRFILTVVSSSPIQLSARGSQPWSPRLPSVHHPAAPSGVDEVEYFAHTQFPKTVYGADPTIQREPSLVHPPPTNIDVSFNNSTLRSAANVNHGTWRDEESEKLRQLAEHSRSTSKLNGHDKIDWDWVVERFGASRTRHQILIKATHLGLKPTSTHPSRIRKRLAKAEAQAAAANAAAAATGAAHSDVTPGSSVPPATEPLNTSHQGSMTPPTAASRHYPLHVLSQTVDTRSKPGETSQTTTSNPDHIPTYEPGGSA